MAGGFNESVCSPPKAPRNDGSTARSAAKEEPPTASFTGFSFKTSSLRFSPIFSFKILSLRLSPTFSFKTLSSEASLTFSLTSICSVMRAAFALFSVCVFTFCAIVLGHHIVKVPNKSKHILQYSFVLFILYFFQQAYSFKDQSFQETNPFKRPILSRNQSLKDQSFQATNPLKEQILFIQISVYKDNAIKRYCKMF